MSLVAVLGLVSAATAQTTLEAPYGNIVVDGNLDDWGALACCPGGPNCQSYEMQVNGDLAASLSYAWDENNLYILLKEYAVDGDPCETTYNTVIGVTPWEAHPFFYDSIGLFRRFSTADPPCSVGDADAPRQDVWIGLTGREEPEGTQRLGSRVNEGDALDLLTSSVHWVTQDDFRYVEASVPMSYILPDPPEVCTTFYMSPLYCDGPWSTITQEMIGGEIHPCVQDPTDATYVHLCPEPTTLILLGLGGLLLRRRRA
jgi:hypothetical protein